MDHGVGGRRLFSTHIVLDCTAKSRLRKTGRALLYSTILYTVGEYLFPDCTA